MAQRESVLPPGGAGLEGIVRRKLELVTGGGALLIAGVLLSLLWAPALTAGFSAPVAQRVFYFHIGAAITSYLAFTFAFAASWAYLRTRNFFFDTLARDAAGLALAFAMMVLTSGPLWASAEWGVAWRFEDSRLMTYLVLVLVFVAYFGVRARVHEPVARARLSATYAVAGYALVPASFFSMYIWQSLHPRVISPGGQGVGAEGGLLIVVAVAGFTLLFLGLLGMRLELSMVDERLTQLQREVDA